MYLARSSAADRVTRLEEGGPNSIAVTNGIVGDEWTLWIVQMALHDGISQYNEWLRAGPISSSVLTARLTHLVEVDVMERVPYSTHPPRHDYRLTPRGRQLWSVLITMWAWEQAWVDDPDENLPKMQHTNCGSIFTPILVCEACNEPVEARDVKGRLGPSGDWSRSASSLTTRRRTHSGKRPHDLVRETMVLLGNRWSAALLGAAFSGSTRFGEFEQQLGAPPTIVAERLRTFCELGVLKVGPNPQRPAWVAYHLTDKGRAFFPVVAATIEWGMRWYKSPDGPAMRMVHSKHQHVFHPRLICSVCGERLRGSSIQVIRTHDQPQPADSAD